MAYESRSLWGRAWDSAILFPGQWSLLLKWDLSSLTLKTAATTGEINAVNSSIMKPLRQPVSMCWSFAFTCCYDKLGWPFLASILEKKKKKKVLEFEKSLRELGTRCFWNLARIRHLTLIAAFQNPALYKLYPALEVVRVPGLMA